MDQVKPWYTSKAIWAGAVAVVAPIAGAYFHVTVSAEDTAHIVDALSTVVEAGAGLVAIYGRVKATKQIG